MMTDAQVAAQVCVAPVVPDAPTTAICSGLPVPRGRAHPLSDWEQDETIYGEQISSQCR